MTTALLILLVAGFLGPILLLLLPLWVRGAQGSHLESLARAREGRQAVYVRGLWLRSSFRVHFAAAADEEGLELVPLVGKRAQIAWQDIVRASWSHDVPNGVRLKDPDREGRAPVLTLLGSRGERFVLAFRTGQAVPLAGVLSLRLGERAPDLPELSASTTEKPSAR